MKLRYLRVILFLTMSLKVHSSDTGSVLLRAIGPPTMSTQIKQVQLSSTKSLVTFSSQSNSNFSKELQKIEVEGIDQSGLEGTLKKITNNERSIQYELLVNHLKSTMPIHKPIFLKITAN